MMQHRGHQQRQSSTLSRTNLCRRLSTISSGGPLSQQGSCRSIATSFPTTITTLVSSFTITSSSPSSSSCSSSHFNRRNTRRIISSSSSSSSSKTTTRNNIGALSCSSVLLSVLAWSVTLLLISSCFGIADAGVIMGHPLGKRSYIDLGCKGVYDKSIFARLDRVCEDCYNLFREPMLHTLCRKDCFTTYYFKGCVESLLMQDEMEQFKMGIKQLHGADPGV